MNIDNIKYAFNFTYKQPYIDLSYFKDLTLDNISGNTYSIFYDYKDLNNKVYKEQALVYVYNILYIGKIADNFCFGYSVSNHFMPYYNKIEYIVFAKEFNNEKINNCSLYITGKRKTIPRITKTYKIKHKKNIQFVFDNDLIYELERLK